MKVNAITFGTLNKTNIAKVKEVQTEQKRSYAQNPVMSQLKAVPLALMIAMSPLNSGASTVQEPAKTEQSTAVQAKEPEVKVFGEKEVFTDGRSEFCRFISYSVDGNNKNLELVGFNYNCYVDNGGVGLLNGIFQAISPEKTEDNKYLVTYEQITNSGNSGVVNTCMIPSEFGEYLIKLAKSRYNNAAIDIVPTSAFEKAFGADVVKNSPDISEVISDVIYPEN